MHYEEKIYKKKITVISLILLIVTTIQNIVGTILNIIGNNKWLICETIFILLFTFIICLLVIKSPQESKIYKNNEWENISGIINDSSIAVFLIGQLCSYFTLGNLYIRAIFSGIGGLAFVGYILKIAFDKDKKEKSKMQSIGSIISLWEYTCINYDGYINLKLNYLLQNFYFETENSPDSKFINFIPEYCNIIFNELEEIEKVKCFGNNKEYNEATKCFDQSLDACIKDLKDYKSIIEGKDQLSRLKEIRNNYNKLCLIRQKLF